MDAHMRSTTGLLAHLIPRITVAVEPAATQSLAYILSAEGAVANELAEFARQAGLELFDVGRVAPEETHGEDNVQPDLTIRDSSDAVRMFIENKFWAGLTDRQPVAYLNALPADTSSLLLFVVPQQRIHSIWNELADRCAHEDMVLENEFREDNLVRAQTANRILAVTSWQHLLARLQHGASASGYAFLEQDIVQLRGLADRMDVDAFLPLRGEEITDIGLARRMINYSGLIDAIVERLKVDGVADTQGLRPTHGYYSAGRYLRLHGRFGAWMGVDLQAWRKYAITPLWWTVGVPGDFSGLSSYTIQEIRRRIPDVHDSDDESLYIPIRLTTGVERDRVIDGAAAQIRDTADGFRAAFPE